MGHGGCDEQPGNDYPNHHQKEEQEVYEPIRVQDPE